MARYIVNTDVHNLERLEITDERLYSGDGNTVVVMLDAETDGKLHEYYNGILNVLLSRNKLILVLLGEGLELRKPICNLMTSYRNYNIYEISSKDILDEEYIKEIELRSPTYEEVQTFVGGDITAYSDINTIVIGIETLIQEGNIDGLKVFLSRHLNSVSRFTEVVDYMKYVIDSSNSGELKESLEKLRKELEKTKERLEDSQEKYRATAEEKNKLSDELGKSRNELGKALEKLDEIKKAEETTGPVIKTYNGINTALINCRTRIVIYFKEVSRVPYINSLVEAIMEFMKIRGIRAKLVIYDNKNGLAGLYKPINVVGSAEYMAKRDIFAGSVEKLVVVEPNPIILDDILTYNSPHYDVVVVYDRMKQANDIVIGNNVHKLFVINSSKDFREAQSVLKITDKSAIITRPHSSIGSETLNIPTIDDYHKSTDTAKISKYLNLVTIGGRKKLIDTILSRARIDTISSI